MSAAVVPLWLLFVCHLRCHDFMRLAGLVLLIPVLVFSCFGFLSLFEPGPGHMCFRVAYVFGVLLSGSTIVRVLFLGGCFSKHSGTKSNG